MECLNKDGFMGKLDEINRLVKALANSLAPNLKEAVLGIHTTLSDLTIEIRSRDINTEWSEIQASILEASGKFQSLNHTISSTAPMMVPVILEFIRQTKIDKQSMNIITGEQNRIAALATILKNVGIYLQSLNMFGFLGLILGGNADAPMQALIRILTSLECPSVQMHTKMTEEWAAINKIIDLLQSKFDR